MIWFGFGLLTVAAVLCVVWPLLRPSAAIRAESPDVTLYREQMAEIDADVARGMLAPGDALGTKAELGRRLLNVADRTDAHTAASRGRQLAIAAAVVALVPAAAIGVYLKLGRPSYGDQPLAARLSTSSDLASAVQRVETHLASHPEDGRGYEVIAPIYLQMGRFDDAANAYAQALRLLGDTPQRQAALGQALVMSAEGVVTAQARGAFEAALKGDPNLPEARFYLAMAAEQDGDKGKAHAILEKLAADAPPNAPWLDVVRRRLANLDAPSAAGRAPPAGPAAAGIASLPPEERSAAIRGMVEGLAARLAENGRDPDGWLRLVRAYKVLGETDKARQALANARRSLADDKDAMARLGGLAHELGLEG